MSYEFPNGGVFIDDPAELPVLPDRIARLYLDHETSSNDPDVKSLNPWDREHCTVCGTAVTWDDEPHAYYLTREVIDNGGREWLQSALHRSTRWVNHHVKYDYHVSCNDLKLDCEGPVLSCTIARTRIFDADRTFKGGYSLDVLVEQLLGYSISHYGKRLEPFLGKKNKDYGRIPSDILGEYACQDVISNRDLDLFLLKTTSEECDWVVQNEEKVTKALAWMERRGLKINQNSVKVQWIRSYQKMKDIFDKINEMIPPKPSGQKFDPGSYTDTFDLLINTYQYPKIKKEGGSDASFDKNILKDYARMPGHEAHSEVVALIRQYRSESLHLSLYWAAWLRLVDKEDGETLHGEYQQNVRSGRTACKQPNSQQLDLIAKAQIEARDGYVFLCYDYSQQEYRWMVHYLKNEAAIKRYNEDPDTDYHVWVAELCGIKRKPAKTMNFCIGFGGGKGKVTSMLAIDPDVIARTNGDPRMVIAEASSIYEGYHRNLPELKRNQRGAENAAIKRGYVRTIYGRRLHLDPRFAYKGFNRVVQSTAADNTKEALTAVSPAFNLLLRELGVHLVAVVHDEFLFEVPNNPEAIEAAKAEIKRCLEIPSTRCRVPIIADCGKTASTWKEAKP